MDVFSKKKRSEIMSRIRSSGTKPEVILRKMVTMEIGKKFKISLNHKKMPGQPDLFIHQLNTAIFVDGCFYHGCPIHGHIPKSNRLFWKKKIIGNQMRDKRNRNALRKIGFHVWRFWEHELDTVNGRKKAQIRLARLLALIPLGGTIAGWSSGQGLH